MNNKIAFALSLMFLSSTALAADQSIDAEVEQAMQKSNAAMVKSVNEMNQTFEKVMPELTKTMAQSMSQILSSITPVMQAMEKNNTFSKASEQLSKDVTQSVNELNLPNTSVDTSDDYLSIKGSNSLDNNSLQFSVNQNPNLITNTSEFIEILKTGAQIPKLSVLAINNSMIPLKEFQVVKIDGNSYLVFDGKDKKQDFSFITGNITPALNIQIQTNGPDHAEQALNFIRSLRSRNLAELTPETITKPEAQPAKQDKKIRLFPWKN